MRLGLPSTKIRRAFSSKKKKRIDLKTLLKLDQNKNAYISISVDELPGKHKEFIDSSSKISLARHRPVWKPISCLKTWSCTIFNSKKPCHKSLAAANYKRDRKTVVTWHPQVCRLPLTMKNLTLKVSNNDIEFGQSWDIRYFICGVFPCH